MRFLTLILSCSLLLTSACTARYLLVDTTSDKVVEYQNDYYVGYSQDSTLELHYNLWEVGGGVWLRLLNRSDSTIVLLPQECYLQLEGMRMPFDHSVDYDQYRQELKEAEIELEYFDRLVPLLSGQWKNLMGPEVALWQQKWKNVEEVMEFEQEDSPMHFEVRVCYLAGSKGEERCVLNEFWAEAIYPLEAEQFRELNAPESIDKADKFYMIRVPGSAVGTALGLIIPIALALL